MKKHILRLLSLLLALSLVRPASAEGLRSVFENLISGITSSHSPSVSAHEDMVYTRPDLEQLRSLFEEVCRRAEGEDVSHILDGVHDFYDAYDWFCTASALAVIHYNRDLTNSDWEAENSFCTAAAPSVDRMLEELYVTLAQSPCREELEEEFFGAGFFDEYEAQGFWDDELVALMEEESRLISQYYDQYSRATSFLGRLTFRSDEMAQTLVDLIEVRSRIAAHAGFDSYADFANNYYFYRDYTPEELSAYLEDIRDTLVPLFSLAMENLGELEECQGSQALDYVTQSANAMGGLVQEACALMLEDGLYDMEAGAHRSDSSFEVYLPSYQKPFLFLNPTGSTLDCLSMAHEFGHFCNDYASAGSMVDIDVCEIFSQGFEYLSLCYHPEAQALTRYKMAESMLTYVGQACYARFEQEMYRLEEPSVEALCQLFEQISEEYSMVDEYFSCWNFIFIPHFYSDPMYVSSYVVSNDAALQLYQLEQETPGQGLKLYLENLDTQQNYFLAFLQEAGLESPFAPGRLEAVAETFQAIFTAG